MIHFRTILLVAVGIMFAGTFDFHTFQDLFRKLYPEPYQGRAINFAYPFIVFSLEYSLEEFWGTWIISNLPFFFFVFFLK